MKPRWYALGFGLALAACGPQAVSTPGAADLPRPGGRMTLSYSPDMANFDPSIAIRSESTHFSPIAYESLVGFKAAAGVEYMDLALEPKLAERWEVSPDAQSYTFQLRKGVRFADLPPVNGRELTASDVKFSYEYYSRTGEFKNFLERKLPPGTFNFMLEGLEGIDLPDRHTAVVRFKDPFVPFLNYAASYRIPIAAREIFDEDGHLQNRIVTTGPFQLDPKATQQGSHWVWKKNASYWQASKPYLDEIKTLLILEENAEQAAFKTKQIDYMVTIDPRAAEEVRKAVPDAETREYPLPNAVHLWMTMKPGDPLSNPRLRKALSLAIDRDEFVRVFGAGRGGWALAGVFSGYFSQDEIKQLVRYDPVEAKRLVAEAGYPNGIDLVYMTSRDYGEAFIAKAELLQSQAKRAGLNINFRLASQNEVGLKRRTAEGWDLAPTNRAVDTDVDSWIYAAFHSRSQNNFGKVNDPQLDALVEAQRRAVDPTRRREAIREAGRYITEHSLGLVLPFQVEYAFTQPYVKSFYPNFGAFRPLADAWVAK